MCPVCVGLIGTSVAGAVSGGTLATLLAKLHRGRSVRRSSDAAATRPSEGGVVPNKEPARSEGAGRALA
jgi:hypothetical protein